MSNVTLKTLIDQFNESLDLLENETVRSRDESQTTEQLLKIHTKNFFDSDEMRSMIAQIPKELTLDQIVLAVNEAIDANYSKLFKEDNLDQDIIHFVAEHSRRKLKDMIEASNAVSLSVATPLAAPLASQTTVTAAAKVATVSVSQSLAASDTHEHATLSEIDVAMIRLTTVNAFKRRSDRSLDELIGIVTSNTEYSAAQVLKVIEDSMQDDKLHVADELC